MATKARNAEGRNATPKSQRQNTEITSMGRGKGGGVNPPPRGWVDFGGFNRHQEEALNHPGPKGWWDYI